MNRLCLLCVIFFLAADVFRVEAQELSSEPEQKEEQTTEPASTPLQNMLNRFRGRAVMMEINARIIEQDQQVSWNETQKKATIPGHPVGLKLVGSNVVVSVQFTPYIRRGAQKFLVAQGQIWMDIPDQGIRYYTSMQTIPLEFGEPIYFFPLGHFADADKDCIEVMITLYPYEEN